VYFLRQNIWRNIYIVYFIQRIALGVSTKVHFGRSAERRVRDPPSPEASVAKGGKYTP
jgi:hypothetical protein